jgi:2-succinyl-5-enolpyruvyl-6-hydroxy-3-cyclohexene-1-carboxylate synthase
MYDHLYDMIINKADLPFTNIWIASQIANKIPSNSSVHFSILSSLRSWNFFEFNNDVTSFSNVGGLVLMAVYLLLLVHQ